VHVDNRSEDRCGSITTGAGSNGSVHARYALKRKSTDLCRLMVPRCTLYKLPNSCEACIVWTIDVCPINRE
jgi:hypothetical protein